MQKDNRLYQLAENVLKNSVKLKKGEKIYIEAFGPAVLDLMEIFIRKATELGGVPFYFYNDEHLLKAVIDNASEEQMKAFGETYRQQMASSDVYVALRGYDDIFAFYHSFLLYFEVILLVKHDLYFLKSFYFSAKNSGSCFSSSARALPRWLMASFSSGVSWA